MLLKDGVVTQALALRLLTVSAGGMLLVALDSSLAARQATCLGSALDLLLVSTTAHDSRVALGRKRVSHILSRRI